MPQSGISGSLNRTARQVDALARVWSSIRERRCALDRELKLKLRPIVTARVQERHDDAEEIAPQSGQRFVFRTEDRAVKLFPPLNEDERERCRREVPFLSEEPIEGLPTVLTARFDPLVNPGDEKEIASAVWTVESPGKRSSEKASRTDPIPISSSVSRSCHLRLTLV